MKEKLNHNFYSGVAWIFEELAMNEDYCPFITVWLTLSPKEQKKIKQIWNNNPDIYKDYIIPIFKQLN